MTAEQPEPPFTYGPPMPGTPYAHGYENGFRHGLAAERRDGQAGECDDCAAARHDRAEARKTLVHALIVCALMLLILAFDHGLIRLPSGKAAQ